MEQEKLYSNQVVITALFRKHFRDTFCGISIDLTLFHFQEPSLYAEVGEAAFGLGRHNLSSFGGLFFLYFCI